MRSEEEVRGMVKELDKITGESPEDYHPGVCETCVHFSAALLWVLEELEAEEITKELLLKKTPLEEREE